MPPIYNGIVLSIADVPGREVTQNARLFAAVAQAADDALLAVFDAKYHYNFWRPVTAIRNGDLDGNDATERDASWTPFIETPMHPEYPCAHCIVAAAVGTVLQAEVGTGAMPTLTTTSYLVKGPARSWTKIDDFMQEVANARVYDGVHFRNSTEVGTAMGKQVGTLAAAKFLRRPDRYSDIAGRCAIAARQRSRCGCCSPGLTFTTRAKSTATTAVMSAMLKRSVAMNSRPARRSFSVTKNCCSRARPRCASSGICA